MPEDKAHAILQRDCQKADRMFAILIYLSPFCDWVTAP
ncbi:hypothetical protein ABIC35_000619 [Sphingomonas trueperi]